MKARVIKRLESGERVRVKGTAPDIRFDVVTRGGKLIASAGLNLTINMIDDVCTQLEYRRKGYATILFSTIFSLYEGPFHLQVYAVNKNAIDLYTKLGFRIEEQTHDGLYGMTHFGDYHGLHSRIADC